MKKIGIILFSAFAVQNIVAQSEKDTLKTAEIQEVIVIGTTSIANKQEKPLGSIDEYLQKSSSINMIRRGAYAWEPVINNMQTERTLITIDGMRIFGACTDKMDPITSYVEVSNLSEAEIISGQQGSCHGSTIGGAVDLKRQKGNFAENKWDFNINSGFESVNQQKIFGAGARYQHQKFYLEADVMSRDAENYKAGNNMEVLYSQFRKINTSGNIGVKIAENHLLEGSVIYDKATDVGYPALPMDVSLAEAVITSLNYQMVPKSELFTSWDTKIYYNTITHRMDDTTRPSVPVHMDMPGWSKTYGYYSKLKGEIKNHQLLMNVNGFYNQSVAEMTMYPNNPEENLMFMYTWPDVRTSFQGIFLEDKVVLNPNVFIKISGSLGFHSNKVASEFGLNSLKIFHPDMKDQKSRLLKNISANFEFNRNGFNYGFGTGYGDRAPSVSEGYGFYLFNSAERYDYIGNPELKNESSAEANAFAAFKKNNFYVKLSGSYFHISDYIIGEIITDLVPMTIGGKGVKRYTALKSATIINSALETELIFLNDFKWKAQLTYSQGRDFQNEPLPYISPLTLLSSVSFEKNRFSTEASVMANSRQKDFSEVYGESETPAFAVVQISAGYRFLFGKNIMHTKIGVENLLDTQYNTYSDWNKIPRPGRNFYLNIHYQF